MSLSFGDNKPGSCNVTRLLLVLQSNVCGDFRHHTATGVFELEGENYYMLRKLHIPRGLVARPLVSATPHEAKLKQYYSIFHISCKTTNTLSMTTQ